MINQNGRTELIQLALPHLGQGFDDSDGHRKPLKLFH